MDFRLKVFTVTAQYLNYTKTASILGISQPAITKHIQELEKCLGVQLFEKKGKKLSLTIEGEHLLSKCHTILKGYEDLEKEAAFLSKSPTTNISLLLPPPLYYGIFTDIIADYCRLSPLSNINCSFYNNQDNNLSTSNLAIVYNYDSGLYKETNKDILSDTLIAVGSGDFNNDEYFDAEELKFTLYSNDEQTNKDIITLFSNSSFNFSKISVIVNLQDSATTINFLLANKQEKRRTPLAVAFLWRSQVEKYLKKGELKEVKITELQGIPPIKRYYSIDTQNNSNIYFCQFIISWLNHYL